MMEQRSRREEAMLLPYPYCWHVLLVYTFFGLRRYIETYMKPLAPRASYYVVEEGLL